MILILLWMWWIYLDDVDIVSGARPNISGAKSRRAGIRSGDSCSISMCLPGMCVKPMRCESYVMWFLKCEYCSTWMCVKPMKCESNVMWFEMWVLPLWNLDKANEIRVLPDRLLVHHKSLTDWHSKSTRKCCKSIQTFSLFFPNPLRKGLDIIIAMQDVLDFVWFNLYKAPPTTL